MSHSDVRTRIQDALSDALRTPGSYPYSYAYVVDVFGDDKAGDVVYSSNDDLRKAPYTISGSTCIIDIGKAQDVAPLTTYEVQGVAVAEAGARNSKRDMAQLQAIHDASSKLGANCSIAEAAGARQTGDLLLVQISETTALAPVEILETVPISEAA